jgi:ABC-2 type transport system permease protein/lipopolysaccharide transport system permease protein
VTVQLDAPLSPDPATKFRRRVRPVASIGELWRSREVVRTLAERDLRARYKQAALGFLWAIVTPIVLMVVFTVFFQRAAQVNTHGVPYPLFSYVALIPWTFFSTCVSSGGMSLITNQPLLNKVYCPREVFPLASMLTAFVDSIMATIALILLFIIFSFMPKPTSVWFPVLLAVQVEFSLGVSLIISAAVVYMRDVRHALPILLQLGLFATPVAYGMETIPARFRGLYSAFNPLAPVIDGYRRTILYGLPPSLPLLAIGAVSATLILCGGYVFFKRLEVGFADAA